jgi:methyl-accepting chemotaxis protein
MFYFNLRKKILSGYLSISVFIIIVGAISVFQFSSLGKLVNYLTVEVAGEVRLANDISSEILSMRTSVEKFIYKNKTKDKEDAEINIKKVEDLLRQGKNDITDSNRRKKLDEIESTSNEYIDKFNKVAIRIESLSVQKNKLFLSGEETSKNLYSLILENKDIPIVFNVSMDALINFISATNEVNSFVDNYGIEHQRKASEILNKILTDLGQAKNKEFKNIIYDIEDYMDNFAGLAAITLKMNDEIDKTLLPLAPEIVGMSTDVTKSGWNEMEVSSIEVNQRVALIGKIILFIVIVSVALGLLIGFLLSRKIIVQITNVVDGLTSSEEKVSLASEQVSSSSIHVAEGASEQAAAIEETSSSLEEILSMTRQNDLNANEANNLMKETKQVVENANQSITKLAVSMQEISTANVETSKIIKTIDEIAFQTNLLALNAAVEAARAGEAGAGFAVVADEVRNLAMRASAAAASTTKLIEGTIEKVKQGSTLMQQADKAFHEVSDKTLKVSSLVSEIATASGKQTSGIDQVNRAVTEMDHVVQKNAANSEESASAAEELKSLAEITRAYVNELRVLVGGKGVTAHSAVKDVNASAMSPKSAQKRLPLTSFTPKTSITKRQENGNRAPEQVIPFDDDEFQDF